MRFQFGRAPADVFIILGNLVNRRTDLIRATTSNTWKHVIAVPGPADADHKDIYMRLCNDNNIILLDNQSVILGETRFIGSTMWSRDANIFWNEEDEDAVLKELKIAASCNDISILLTSSPPRYEWMQAVAAAGAQPRAVFYPDDKRAISGTAGGIFFYGCNSKSPEKDIVFSYGRGGSGSGYATPPN